MAKRLASGRREDLLDGVMQIIQVRGFSHVRISEMARELHCSVATLYKIAPSKDSLVLLAIRRWGENTLEALEARSGKCTTAASRARTYFQGGAQSIHDFSTTFFVDTERFESTRVAWTHGIVDRYIDRFVELVEEARTVGEVRPVNTRLLAEVLRQAGLVTRDERVLRASNLTNEEAVMAVDEIVWCGISKDCAPGK